MQRMRDLARQTAFLTWAAAVLGCGDTLVEPGAEAGTLLTVNGELTWSSAVDIPEQLRVAVVWVDAFFGTPEDPAVWTGQSVEVATFAFPATFRLRLTRLPPDEVVIDDMDGRMAVGVFAAFEDGDADGQLTLPDLYSTDLPDRILGASDFDTAFLVYWEGPRPPAQDLAWSLSGVEPGFNLMVTNPAFQAALDELEAEWRACARGEGEGDGYDMQLCYEDYQGGTSDLVFTVPMFVRLGSGDMVSITLEESPNLAEQFCPVGGMECRDDEDCPSTMSCRWGYCMIRTRRSASTPATSRENSARRCGFPTGGPVRSSRSRGGVAGGSSRRVYPPLVGSW